MSLSQKIAAALDAHSEAGPLPFDVTAEDGRHCLSLHLTATGKVGLAFDALNFTAKDRPAGSPDALRAWGDQLVDRLTYLMEPLVVLEVDSVGGEAELRSQVPTMRSGNRSFYEIRLDQRGTLRFARVAVDDATRQRRPVACQLTREVLDRLVEDIVASLG